MHDRIGNVGNAERWISIAAGLGLTLAALRARGFLGRATAGAAGLSLLTRGVTGYCGMKAALTGESSLGEGLSEQFNRTRATFTPARQIDSLESLYPAELQELHSAEKQLSTLVEEISGKFENRQLEQQLRGYATELRSRAEDLQRILTSRGINPRQHPDQAMRALANETRKMAHVCVANVRDAALVASLQRIIHYKIAGYGNVASYAKALNRTEEAARFAEYASRDKTVDRELTDLAKGTLNPQARFEPQGRPANVRPH